MKSRAITAARKPRKVKLRTNGKHNITGATITAPVGGNFGMNRILRPQARYNWLLPSLAAITPQFIEMTLNGAMAGNHVQQYELFDLMLRTWPELSACSNELFEGVLRKKLVFEPFAEEDEKPTPSAIEKTKLISAALREMDPDTENDGNDLEGTLKNILDAWIRGFSVSEIVWETKDVQTLGTINAPRTTFWVEPVQYAFSTQNMIGLSPRNANQGFGIYPFTTTSPAKTIVDPFPPNKFLVAIHKAKAGSPLAGPLFVPLAWWWCAANFSSDWLLNLAQLFGLPFRWASYPQGTPDAQKQMLADMMQNMGSAGWAILQEGQLLNLSEPGRQGSDHSPQGELLDRADRYARLLILGQTMTGTHGTMGKGGGQAFGVVEKTVKDDRIDAAGKFACAVINRQLVPYILNLNYGDASEAPSIKFLEDEVAGLTEAQRDTALSKLMPIGLDYLRKKYDVPEPADGEETTADNAATPDPFGGFGGNQFGQQDQSGEENPDEGPSTDQADEPAKAGDDPGHEFHGNQHTKIAKQLKPGVKFRHKNGNLFVVHSPEGSFYSMQTGKPVPGKFGARVLKNGKPFGPMRDMNVGNVAEILDDEIHSGDKPGHAFHGNQHVNIGEMVNTPHGRGMVVAQDHLNVWVSTTKGIKKVPRTQAMKIPVMDEKKFPGISQSAENERRAHLNAQLHSKLEKLNAIEDDAIYSRELLQLAGSIQSGDTEGHPFRGNQWTTDTGRELDRHETLKDDERPDKATTPDILDTKEKLSSGKHIVSVYHRVSEPMSVEEARQGKAPKKYFVGPTGTYEGRSVGEAIKQYHKSDQILKDNEKGGFSDKIYKVAGVHYREYGKNALIRLRPKADWAQKDSWL